MFTFIVFLESKALKYSTFLYYKGRSREGNSAKIRMDIRTFGEIQRNTRDISYVRGDIRDVLGNIEILWLLLDQYLLEERLGVQILDSVLSLVLSQNFLKLFQS